MVTPPYQKKAVMDYQKRKIANGEICYKRYIKKEWKPFLEELLAKLREEAKDK